MNVFTPLRDWWHRPVTDRLDEIAANTRPATVKMEMEPPPVSNPRGFIRAHMDQIAARERLERPDRGAGRTP